MPSVLKVNEIQSDTSLPLVFNVGNAERGRIDTSGNMSLGATPNTWTIFKALEVGAAGTGLAGAAGQPVLFSNCYYNAGWKYAANGFAANYDQINGQHRWFNVASGTAGNAITFTQAMTLDANGQLAFGSSTNPWSSSFSRAIYIEAGSGKPGAIAVGTAAWTGGRSIWLTNNAYTSSAGTFRYVSSGGLGVGLLQVGNDSLTFSGAASGTADTDITFTTVFDVARNNTFALQGATRTSGTGITFPATQSASSDANTLDDYEEGSWTPAASTGTTTCTPTTVRCKYIKIGNQVTCWAEAALTVSATSFVISGLPFAPPFRQGCGHGQFVSSCNFILIDTDSTMTISVPATFSSITSRWFVTYTL